MRVWSSDAPPRAVVLALHGFNDYSKSFEAPAAAWRKAGIAVYAYDQRGFGAAPHHGLWPGVAAMTGDLAVASRLLRARYPGTPLYLLGESMGASVILAAYGGADRPDADGVGRAPDRAPAFGIVADYCFMMLTYLPPITLRMAVAPEPSPTSFIVVSPETPL